MKRWHLYVIIAVGVALAATFFYTMFGPDPQIASNEAAAIRALRQLSSAQELYKCREYYGECYNLYGPNPHGGWNRYIDARVAAADPDYPNHQPLSGYIIDISLNPPPCIGSDWCAVARPAKWGVTGTRNFKITSDGVIRYNEIENSSEFTEVITREMFPWRNK
jgi:hypothetical protein